MSQMVLVQAATSESKVVPGAGIRLVQLCSRLHRLQQSQPEQPHLGHFSFEPDRAEGLHQPVESV